MTGAGHRGGQGQDPSKSTAMHSSIGGFVNSASFRLLVPPQIRERLSTPPRPLAVCGCNEHFLYAASRCLALHHDNDPESTSLSRVDLPSAYLKQLRTENQMLFWELSQSLLKIQRHPRLCETATMTCFGSLSGLGLSSALAPNSRQNIPTPWTWVDSPQASSNHVTLQIPVTSASNVDGETLTICIIIMPAGRLVTLHHSWLRDRPQSQSSSSSSFAALDAPERMELYASSRSFCAELTIRWSFALIAPTPISRSCNSAPRFR